MFIELDTWCVHFPFLSYTPIRSLKKMKRECVILVSGCRSGLPAPWFLTVMYRALIRSQHCIWATWSTQPTEVLVAMPGPSAAAAFWKPYTPSLPVSRIYLSLSIGRSPFLLRCLTLLMQGQRTSHAIVTSVLSPNSLRKLSPRELIMFPVIKSPYFHHCFSCSGCAGAVEGS